MFVMQKGILHPDFWRADSLDINHFEFQKIKKFSSKT